MRDHSSRADHEIEHGRYLAERDPEWIWGWASPAGQIRARRRARLILEGARLQPSARVLEIGCGTGLFTMLFAESGVTLTAVDISSELIERARRRELPSGVTFLAKRFEDCEVDGPFDAVIGNSILHHLDLDATWPRIRALLKPGGWMSFAEPNLRNPQVWAERRFRRFFPQVSPDETAFVRGRLRRELLAEGFSQVDIQPFDWLHPAVPPSLIEPVSWLGRQLEHLPGVREFAGSLTIRACRSLEAGR